MSARELVSELCICFQNELRLYRTLLDLSLAQHKALRDKEVRAVHAILQEVEIEMLERSKAEVRRGKVIQSLAEALEVSPDVIDRDLICSVVEGDVAETIITVSDELKSLVHELDKVVAMNRSLIEHELELITSTVKWMTTDRSVKSGYKKGGLQAEPPKIRLLDAHV